uniref:Uncharacterized protein n=1 Tax=Romanomermis culicivorax TaxID=13658 RepID=A0A915JRE7_ROMCU
MGSRLLPEDAKKIVGKPSTGYSSKRSLAVASNLAMTMFGSDFNFVANSSLCKKCSTCIGRKFLYFDVQISRELMFSTSMYELMTTPAYVV